MTTSDETREKLLAWSGEESPNESEPEDFAYLLHEHERAIAEEAASKALDGVLDLMPKRTMSPELEAKLKALFWLCKDENPSLGVWDEETSEMDPELRAWLGDE